METMDGFDPMAMSYMANPMPVGLLHPAEFPPSGPSMDFQDHLSNFDTETYMRLVGHEWQWLGRVKIHSDNASVPMI